MIKLTNYQKSQKYKEKNNRSYLIRFSSLLALMPALRVGFSSDYFFVLYFVKLSVRYVFWSIH